MNPATRNHIIHAYHCNFLKYHNYITSISWSPATQQFKWRPTKNILPLPRATSYWTHKKKILPISFNGDLQKDKNKFLVKLKNHKNSVT